MTSNDPNDPGRNSDNPPITVLLSEPCQIPIDFNTCVIPNVPSQIRIQRHQGEKVSHPAVAINCYELNYQIDKSAPTLRGAVGTVELSLHASDEKNDEKNDEKKHDENHDLHDQSHLTFDLTDTSGTFYVKINLRHPGTHYFLLVVTGKDASGRSIHTHHILVSSLPC